MSKVLPALFTHEQVTPATVWNIQHDLSGNASSGIPIVDVSILVEGVLTKVLAKVNIIDKNSLTITFSSAQSGKALVII